MRKIINIFYFKRYKKFIQSRAHRVITLDYVENHHIIPYSVFKNNVTISLTAREHYIAHKILTKVFKKNTRPWFSMVKAFGTMFMIRADGKNRTHTKSRDYENYKKMHSEAMKFNNPMHDPEVVKRASHNMRKSWTYERREAQAERARNQPRISDEGRQRLSSMWTGVPRPKTPEHTANYVKSTSTGLFITPWGEFDSPAQASKAEGNIEKLSRYLINKYCKDQDNTLYSFIPNGRVETRGMWKKNK
jgi:hypothetical protein